MMAVPTLLLTLATLLCASAAPAREVLFAASPSESIDARSGAGLVSPWSGADPQANAVTAYLSKDPAPWTFPLPTESVESDACQQLMGSDLIAYINCINADDGQVTKIKLPSEEIDLSNGLGADNVRSRRRTRRARRRRPNARPPPRPSPPRPLAAAAARTPSSLREHIASLHFARRRSTCTSASGRPTRPTAERSAPPKCASNSTSPSAARAEDGTPSPWTRTRTGAASG